MKVWVKVALGILLAVVIAVGAVVVWQWESIRAVYIMLTTDEETIVKTIEDERVEQEAWLREEHSVSLLAPTSQQSDALLEGNISPEEIKANLGITSEIENQIKQTTETPELKGNQKKTLTKAEIDNYVNLCVAELYACEVDLMARLGEMKTGIETEWDATTPKNITTKNETILRWLGKVYKLETEIDAKVKSIIAKYNGILKSYGADTSGVDRLWNNYLSKKANQKAYYMNLYT